MGIEEKPEYLSSELKTKLGTGGAYKEGQIILQADHIEAVKTCKSKKDLMNNPSKFCDRPRSDKI